MLNGVGYSVKGWKTTPDALTTDRLRTINKIVRFSGGKHMQTNYEKKGNVFVGFIGAFIGAVVGAVVWLWWAG